MKKRTVTTLCALLLALALALAVYFAAAKANAGTVELRNTGSAIEWKYSGEGDESWRELTTTAALVGADGQNGVDGKDGADGKDGKDGADGRDGACAGYFYGTGQCDNFDQTFSFSVRQSDGDLIRWDRSNTAVTLKKGHTYSISLAGSVCLKSSSRMVICTQVNDNFGDNLCADSTRVQTYVYDTDFSYRWQPFAFNRIFTATEDTPVKYHMTKIYPNTQLVRVNYNLTILALN